MAVLELFLGIKNQSLNEFLTSIRVTAYSNEEQQSFRD